MIDGPFRSVLPRYVRPLLRLYERRGVTPNQITAAGFGVAVVAALLVVTGWHALACGVWWLSRLLDGTDGIYARESGKVSDFGGYLDIVCDMGSYGVMVLGCAVYWPEWTVEWGVVLLLYTLCITSALALGALEAKSGGGGADNRTLRLGAGLAEGGETGLAYTLFLLWHAATPVLLGVWIIVLAWTIVARSVLAYRLFGGR